MTKFLIIVLALAAFIWLTLDLGVFQINLNKDNKTTPDNYAVDIRLELKNSSGKVKLTFHNPSNKYAYIAKWQTLKDGELNNSIFKITTGLDEVNYIGRQVKLAAPTKPEDYIQLAPGQTLTSEVDLQNFYDFKWGVNEYQIQYISIAQPLQQTDFTPELKSNTLTATIIK